MSKDRLKMIEDMLSKNPTDTFLNYAAALECKKFGKVDRAQKLLENVKDIDIKYLAVYFQLGKIYEEKGEPKKAIDMYKEGIKIAKELDDGKTQGELAEALLMLDEDW